jgi:hypothetical protein
MAAGTYDVIVVNPEGAVGGRGAGGVLAGVLPASAAFAQDAATAAPVEPATEGTTEAAPAEGEDEAGEEAVPAAAPEVASEETASAGGIGLSFGVRAQVGFAQVFGDLGVAPAGEIEIGYRLPFLGRRLGVFVAGGYQYTYGSGSGADDGLTAEDGTPYPGGYSWSLDEHAVTVTLGLFGRLFADADAFSPYLWAGPRVYLLETAIDAGAGGSSFGENTETSTEFGVGGGVGVEWVLGPGPLFAEVEVGWSPLEHEITGGSSSGQLGLAFGYRVLL